MNLKDNKFKNYFIQYSRCFAFCAMIIIISNLVMRERIIAIIELLAIAIASFLMVSISNLCRKSNK